MTPIDDALLVGVSGGMRWEDFRPSENVEDRRHLSPRESMRIRPAPVAPLPQAPRTPGDLPSQAGIDDIARHGRRRRR
ncbi:MAG: neutral zinc metallopeptidase [Myxococcota bacterium]|nr:hypothetical protein [Deltaproteobacteria bacterium]MDQ3340996.1 neutral zinc metallopeptidase [Myxococcota bacterium]